MRSFLIAHLAAFGLVAWEGASAFETVHAAVIIARTGEHEPFRVDEYTPSLTPLGANQMEKAGTFFRARYLTSTTNDQNYLTARPISGISTNNIDNAQLYVQAAASQYTAASAQAFMQGLYPPYDLDATPQGSIDFTSVMSDGRAIEAPLGGYQYPSMLLTSPEDPETIYVQAEANCPHWADVAGLYFDSAEYQRVEAETKPFYERVCNVTVEDIDQDEMSYAKAYELFEYLDYQARHDKTIYDQLRSPELKGSLKQLRLLADQYEWAMTQVSHDPVLTVSGRTLASKIYQLLNENKASQGSLNKLSLMVTEFRPFMSFFALNNLQNQSPDFAGIPRFASAMAFELYSRRTPATPVPGTNPVAAYPADDELMVRFFFRNGTSAQEDNDPSDLLLPAYPLFSRGPSQTEMTWADFEAQMRALMLDTPDGWCHVCGADKALCAAYQTNFFLPSAGGGYNTVWTSGFSPQVAGVIGAAATLGFLGALVALAMLFGGVRVRRVERAGATHLGGFKGGAKMASDADLVLPQNGARAGVVSKKDLKPKERIGSWELHDKEQGIDGMARPEAAARRPSWVVEEDVIVNPYQSPVQPDERV